MEPVKPKKYFYNFVTEEIEEVDELITPKEMLIKETPPAVVRKGLLALANEIRFNFENSKKNAG